MAIRSLRCVVVMACVIGASACAPSLVAVRSTANIGTGLAAFDGVFDAGVTYCQQLVFGSAPDPQCAQIAADLANWHAVNHALVSYAAALIAMADDTKDRNHHDEIYTALNGSSLISPTWSTAVNINVMTGVSAGATSLVLGIEGVYRRERLAKTIEASDDAIAAIVKGIDKYIEVVDHEDKNALEVVDQIVKSIQDGTSPAPDKKALTILMSVVQAEIAANRAQLSSYRTVAKSFAKAHSDIKSKLRGLGDHKADLELMKLIGADVAAIVKNANLARQTPD